MDNPLNRAAEIVYNRVEEEDRKYGDFYESMVHGVEIFNSITRRDLTPQEFYMAMVCLKISRETIHPKDDNVTDLAAYFADMHESMRGKVKKGFPNVDY